MSKLQEIRKSRNLSQAKLAEEATVNYRALTEYESGKRDINGAKLKTLLKLCIVLKCDLADILEDPELLRLLEYYNKRKSAEV